MKISVFLSYPKPHRYAQQKFVERLEEYLRMRGLEPRTLGVTDYDMDAPLKAIRRLMLESNGLITIAFRRSLITEVKIRANADIGEVEESQMRDVWLTSPYCQIEPAMAYQLGLPVLVLREAGVIQEGLLEKGAVSIYMPEFSLEEESVDYLMSHEWNALVGKWEGFVRFVVEMKGNPPKLYGY
uniref:TIR domain-containing protein n=1 Tax=Candidatus Kentrum sp. MB TaxID=2138164 RepID=A0A450XEU0_9GAMM|nr:MAG: hypothetical protein BECKMB1821G_GA0114241_100165 [Candidatus Kentron sp. MB]VFK27749.1 MAG: hypothetical protein BECKMB1821I_GA0114274_100467 [Candidatus Kentron sp. MB]VFK74419.1 MAG: hypothetical protein BECKMB1821H_GA0114242_100467 [Candidatus Kentron sp. MB]